MYFVFPFAVDTTGTVTTPGSGAHRRIADDQGHGTQTNPQAEGIYDDGSKGLHLGDFVVWDFI